jgi:hypothetical protein
MKTAAIIFLLTVTGCQAQPPAAKERQPGEMKKLESVTWDLKGKKLVWTVQNGTVTNGELKQTWVDRYEISPDMAEMAFDQERRGFSSREAAALQQLLNTLSVYCAESVVWWDQGKGEKVGPDGSPQRERIDRPAPAPRRNKQPAPTPIAHVTRQPAAR